MLISSSRVMPAPVSPISSRYLRTSCVILVQVQSMSTVTEEIMAWNDTHRLSRFLILRPHTPFSLGVFARANTSLYFSCSSNIFLASSHWYSVLGLLPPLAKLLLAPGSRKRPCFISSSSSIAPMRRKFRSSSFQLQIQVIHSYDWEMLRREVLTQPLDHPLPRHLHLTLHH